MPKNKKKFIPKENAVTFQLVHRSQQDPLVADENAPQHVLKPYKGKKNKEEEHKYGIFFDDEYDYMQHLKSVSDPVTDWEPVVYNHNEKRKSEKSQGSKVTLPSSVFQSDYEEPIGLLNKAAPIYGPRLELDPDIVAAMDDDFDYDDPDNVLEENFMELANCSESESQDKYSNEYESDFEEPEDHLNYIETKSRFTDYSMSSSVIRRNEQLTLLDDRFEKMFEKYDEDEIGSLACEDIEGNNFIENERLIQLAEKQESVEPQYDPVLKEKIISSVIHQEEETSEEETYDLVVEDNEKKWDCESILSTYSNIYNHPAKISEPKNSNKIKVSKKTGIPLNVLDESRLTAEALSMLNGNEVQSGTKSIVSYISELSIRPKNESPEEKKIRKKNLKEFRRDRRIEKKLNTIAFKDEKIRQEKILLNLKNNQRGIKIF